MPVRRGPQKLDTILISRLYMKPELCSKAARRQVVEVPADKILREVRSARASVAQRPKEVDDDGYSGVD